MTSSTKRQAAKRSTHEREVGPCPGCKTPVVAELDVATFLGDVTMDDQGQPQVSVENVVTAVRIVHRCEPGEKGAQLEAAGEPKAPKKRAAKKTAASPEPVIAETLDGGAAVEPSGAADGDASGAGEDDGWGDPS